MRAPGVIISGGGDQRVATPKKCKVNDWSVKMILEGTDLISASLANFASGNTLMLIKSPPHCLYIRLSALVENCGPSMQTIHLPVWSLTPRPSASSALRIVGSSHLTRLRTIQTMNEKTIDENDDLLDKRKHALVTERVSEHRMRHHTRPIEETRRPDPFRPINDLVWECEVARCYLFPQASYS